MTGAAARIRTQSESAVPSGPVVVALSGGADSAVAAWVACSADPRRAVSSVFVDHGWPASEAMRAAAAAIAERLGIDLRVVAVAPTDSETAARGVRLDALANAAGGMPVITGHHADDSAETVVLNLLRGAGATGLSGIPGTRLPFVRPLLGCSGTEVRLAAVELGLPFRDDPANEDTTHLRNRVRLEVLPALDAVASGVAGRLATTSSLLADDDALIQRRADDAPLTSEPGAVRIPMGLLVTQPRPVASRIVRRALRMLAPPYAGSSADVAKVLASVSGSPAELTGGLRTAREGPFVVVVDPSLPANTMEPRAIAVSETHSFGPCTVSLRLGSHRSPGIRTGLRLALDADLAQALVVRCAEAGERIDIGTGTKLVRDAMAEAHIPARIRSGWPVLDARGRIVAVAGVRVAAWAAPGASTRSVIELITERSSC